MGFASKSVVFCSPRGVAQFGRALRSGRRGRVFESRHPDIVFPRKCGIYSTQLVTKFKDLVTKTAKQFLRLFF